MFQPATLILTVSLRAISPALLAQNAKAAAQGAAKKPAAPANKGEVSLETPPSHAYEYVPGKPREV